MRYYKEYERSPSEKRRRHRPMYDDHRRTPSPKKYHSSNHKRARYSHSSDHSPKHGVSPRPSREPISNDKRTLYVKRFSSKLSSDVVKQHLHREYGKFGDLSINISNVDGDRVAMMNFKHAQSAVEALYSKPTVYLHDRLVEVSVFCDLHSDKSSKRAGTSRKHNSDSEAEFESLKNDKNSIHMSSKLNSNFAGLLAKSAGLPPTGSASLLGMPGMTSSAMMAAAARALGLNPLSGVLPNPQLTALSHPRLNSRHYDNNKTYSLNNADSNPDMKATRTLFVGSLEPDITEKEVRNAFEKYGFIEQVDIKRSPTQGVHCYAFVRYQNVDMASRAKSSMSGRLVRSLPCKIGYGKPIISQCLYIGGLEAWKSMESLKRLLLQFGDVSDLDWSVGSKYGIVVYEAVECAIEAHRQLKGLPIAGRPHKRLRVDFVNLESINNRSPTMNDDNSPDGKLIKRHNPENNNVNKETPRSSSTIKQFNKQNGMDKLRDARQNNLVSPEEISEHLNSIVTLNDLEHLVRQQSWRGQFLLKNTYFTFRCLLAIGNKSIGQELIAHSEALRDSHKTPYPTLHITRRGNLDSTWAKDASRKIEKILSTADHNLCLMLVLPESHKHSNNKSDSIPNSHLNIKVHPLHVLIAYLRLKDSVGIIYPVDHNDKQSNKAFSHQPTRDSNSLFVYLFTPSNFTFGLLKQVAPSLSSDLAATTDYMVLVVWKC